MWLGPQKDEAADRESERNARAWPRNQPKTAFSKAKPKRNDCPQAQAIR
jgi:hypothetical protein